MRPPGSLSRYLDSAQTLGEGVRDRLLARPGSVTAGLAALFLSYAAYRLFEPLPAGTWPELRDSVIFEYIGWYLTHGHRLYIDVWEIKPPLAFELTAGLALLAGDDIVLYHGLNLLANGGAVVLGAAAAAGIVHELTDDVLGAVVAGLSTFTLPFYFYRALLGFKSKYFVIAAGLGCLYLAYRERPVSAGVAGAVAIGFWQLAIVFPLGALGRCWQTGGRDSATRFVAAGAVTGTLILLPIVVWGALPAMITEVLLTPLLVTESHSFSGRVRYLFRILGKSLPVFLIGLAGIAGGLAPRRLRREWPLVLATGWFTVQVVALDFDKRPDLFPWLAVVALGVGLVVAEPRQRHSFDQGDEGPPHDVSFGSRALAVAILVMAALSVATMGGIGTGLAPLTDPETFDTAAEMDPEITGATTYNATERQYVYWNRVELPTCRALGGLTQFRLVNQLGLADGRPWYEAPCGRFGPAWRATQSKYGF